MQLLQCSVRLDESCLFLVTLQAEQRVDAEAERRLASIGSDRSQWPAVAREEVTRLETKHQVLTLFIGFCSTAQSFIQNACNGILLGLVLVPAHVVVL